jgi:hypothetical protein
MIILAILIILGTIFQGVVMFRTGSLQDFGIPYFGPLARDGVWHEALVSSLSRSVPPINPGISGEVLTNYHYYYDLVVALVAKLGIPSSILIYKILPILFSVLLGIGTYKLSMILFKDKKTSLLSVFFAYFASSFGWVVSLIKNEPIGGESAFWANQPVSMNLNPPYAISLVFVIFSILLVFSYIKKPKFVKALGIVILAGSLIGFKVYAGIILLGGLFVLALKRLVFDKDYKLLFISIFSFFISAIIFLPQGASSASLIEFKPFWLIDTMIDAGDRVGIPNFTSRRFAYLGEGKWIHLVALEAICFLIFFIGNLGTRIVGVFGLGKKKLKSDSHILIFSMMIVSFVPSLLFVQKGNTWNIIQFFYYFLFFSGLYAANALSKMPGILVVIILLMTPISSISTFRSWLYPNPPSYIPSAEVSALNFLENENGGTVLKYPYNSSIKNKYKDPYPLFAFADNAYVSAYSTKDVYLEDVEQQIVLGTNYKDRLEKANRFFVEKDLVWSNSFLKENEITYVYLPKVYELPMAEEEYLMDKIFENDGVNIYKVR